MNVNFAPNGIVQIENARIIFRNFAGEGTKFNSKGDRNFCVVINDEEIANALMDVGYNVKIKPAREEGDAPFMYLKVNVRFNERGPSAYLETGNSKVRLSEDTIEMLDNIDIESCDLDIRPYDWEFNGKSGRTAYLQGIWVVQHLDRFAARYGQDEYDDVPFHM